MPLGFVSFPFFAQCFVGYIHWTQNIKNSVYFYVKFSFAEVVMLIGLALLALTAYDQHKKLLYARETIVIQDEAIKKQKELINHQIRYISFFEMQNINRINDPIYRGPS